MSKLTALLRGRGLGGVLLAGGILVAVGVALPPIWHALAQADTQTAPSAAPVEPQPPSAMQAPTPRTVPADANPSAAPAAPAPAQTGQPSIIDSILGKANQLATSAADGSLAVKAAFKLLSTTGPAAAIAAAKDLPDGADRKLVLWLVATSADPKVSAPMIASAMQELKDWPGQNLLKLRYELAFLRDNSDPKEIIKVLGLGAAPVSDSGTLALARAYKSQNRPKDAADVLRPYWRNNRLSADIEKTILAEFPDALTKVDHKARMEKMLYDSRNDEGLRAAKLIDKDATLLAEAWIAVNKRTSNAATKLNAVPATLQKDPAFIFARAQSLRRQDKFADAAALLLTAPTDPKLLVDGNAWSEERRVVGRKLADTGDAKTAYKLVSVQTAVGRVEKVESEWEAGWYAFRYLGDAKGAATHFKNIGDISGAPLSASRSAYWLGRTEEAQGHREAAEGYYRKAAAYPTTFYGQLATIKLNVSRLSVADVPTADEAGKKRFDDRELVKALRRLTEMERPDAANTFIRSLADRLTDPVDIGLLAGIAEKAGDHQMVLNIGKNAQQRGLGVDIIAFPTGAIPKLLKDAAIEPSVIYAIARQESTFDIATVSSAGALGLMQLMPGTAKETATAIGMKYEKAKLTTDAAYNATLGAAYLAGLVSDFNGSYALAFASYNAGKSRVTEWMKTYGDPRDPKVDAIDWIERIPFSETRNYVMRTLENLQVYRLRAGFPALKLESDIVGRRS